MLATMIKMEKWEKWGHPTVPILKKNGDTRLSPF